MYKQSCKITAKLLFKIKSKKTSSKVIESRPRLTCAIKLAEAKIKVWEKLVVVFKCDRWV